MVQPLMFLGHMSQHNSESKMTLKKTTEIGMIQITNDVVVGIRQDTVITEKGEELSRNHHRRLIVPGKMQDDEWVETDISNEADVIQRVCGAVWTEEAISKYKKVERV